MISNPCRNPNWIPTSYHATDPSNNINTKALEDQNWCSVITKNDRNLDFLKMFIKTSKFSNLMTSFIKQKLPVSHLNIKDFANFQVNTSISKFLVSDKTTKHHNILHVSHRILNIFRK